MWKVLGTLIVVIVLGVMVLVVGARFADGPLAIVAGGAFRSGEFYRGPEPDWSFVRDRPTVEFQLVDPERSRTTWITEYQGKLYIPSGYMNSPVGRIWKQWPIEAERDGRAILRVDGKLYDRKLIRIKSGPEIAPVVQQLAEKYSMPVTPAAVDSEDLWIFELAPSRSQTDASGS